MQAFRPEGVDDFAQQVFANRRVGRFVVGPFTVEQTETFMVFRRDDEIRHAGLFGGFGPFLRIEHVRIEQIEILLVLFIGDLLIMADPFMPRQHGIQSPMDEHAKPIMRKPARVAFSVLAHFQLLFVILFMDDQNEKLFSQYACLKDFQAFLSKKCELDGLNAFSHRHEPSSAASGGKRLILAGQEPTQRGNQ